MHEEAGSFTLLPGARGFHGLFGARADPVRYRAADQSAHRSVSHRGSARSKRAMVASGVG